MDVYPCFTYRDVGAALDWLAAAFGVEPRVVGEPADGEIHHAVVVHGQGMIAIESERPEDLHGSHTGNGWVYLKVADIDAHFQRAQAAGVQILNEPHAGPGGMRGYSARDFEGNVWTFGDR